jgi:NAD(P)-dependent dehydrogenase (short-subunit alcohol dehydrogenase family)
VIELRSSSVQAHLEIRFALDAAPPGVRGDPGQLGPHVRVNAISPGAVPTEIMMTALELKQDDLPALERTLRLPMRRLGTPEDLGAAVLYPTSPASGWVTGQVIRVAGIP